jgi:4'-phosphopantetheinyl transferase
VTIGWLEQTAAEVPQADWWLSRAEQEHLGGLRFDKRRADWRLGRWTAKLAVSKTLALPDLDSIEIRPAPTGAPKIFVRGDLAPISISISHSNGSAMCAISGPRTWLGCDIEKIEPRSEAFVAEYFTPAEQAALSGENRWTTMAAYWSAKESALKALGIGLGIDMLRLSVQVSAGHGWAPLTVRYAHLRSFHGWWSESGGFVRTVAAAPAPCAPLPIL